MKSSMTWLSVGDRVKVRSGKEHDEMTKDKEGVIAEISSPALGIKFDGMEEIHKWYVDNEVEKVESKDSKSDSKDKPDNKH